MKTVWQIQEAKNQFSRVVESALNHGVQTITKHGKPVVVIVAAETYRKSQPRRRIVDVLQACPAPGLELHRHDDAPRSIDL